MIRTTRVLAALVYFACITLTACGGGGSSSSYSSTAATAAEAAATPVASAASGSTTSTTSAFTLSGVVTGFTAATVNTTGTAALSTATDSSGNFSFTSLAAGSYTVTPSQTGYLYSPVSRAETISTASITDVSFAATASSAATYTLSGTVSGSVMAGVTLTLNGMNVGSALTDMSGNYSFAGLVSGTYTVAASLNGSSFSAPLIVTLGNTDSTGNNFTSSTQTGDGIEFTAVATLPQATAGVPYSGSVVQTIAGGTSPYHYEAGLLDDGTPPLGMIVNPNGDVTGTATVPGLYVFDVCAVDSAGSTSTCEPTSLTVVAAPVATPTPPVAAPVPTVTLTASPASTASGAGSTLKWSSTNATVCTASGGWSGSKNTSGTLSVSPASSTTYTLSCAGTGGAAKASVLVTVTPSAPAAPSVSLTASATTITAGTKSTLKWSSKNASVCTGSGGWSGNQGTSGTLSVAPTSTTTYALSCSSASGSNAEASTKITVNAASAPTPAPTVTLTASPATITAGAASTLTWSTKDADSCTASSGWSGAKADSGTAGESPTATTTYTLSCSGAGGTTQASARVTVNTPVATASGTSWVYYDGSFDWPGDFDFAAVANYSDTSGAPLSGAHDIMITSSPYGGWLPYAQNWDFNSAPYTKLTFSLKPTRAGQTWQVYFVKVGDTPVGISINVSDYGPAPVEGQWGTYTIPLSVLGVLGQPIYKFAIQDQSGAGGNVWYIDNVGFAP